MNDSDSWWARKLGRAPAPAQPAGQPYNGPTGPPAAQTAPLWPNGQPANNGQPPPVWVIDPQTGQRKLNTMAWQGGRATKTETALCPNCGGSNFFSRTQGHQGERMGVMNRSGQMCAPAPQCADCSYNGQFVIFGGD